MVLVQCAFVAVRNDEKFRNFYERIKRKGSQKAIVATARKFLTVIYAVLRDKKPYVSCRIGGTWNLVEVTWKYTFG